MPNPALVGNQPPGSSFGLSGLKSSLSGLAKNSSFQWGATSGIFELISGGGKLKAVLESIKWAAFARAGVAGFAAIIPMAYALVTGIRKAVTESGILQAAMQRISTTKVLTTQFTAFLGSVALARQRVGELYAFVANSKFNMDEASNASRVLTILTNGSEGGIGSLKVLGAVARATGNSLQELALYYGKFSEQSRNGEDISGTVSQLKEMGVISESTANSLINLQRSGASASQMMTSFRDSVSAVAAVGGNTGQSVEELQDKIEKLKQAAAEGFGKAWMEQETRDLENQVKLWTALSGAAERFGTNLEAVTGSATTLKNTLYDVTGTDFFKSSLKTLADMVFTLPIAIALYQTLKSLMAGKIPGKGIVSQMADAARIIRNPAAAATRGGSAMLALSGDLAEERLATMAAGGTVPALQGLKQTAASGAAKGFDALAASLRGVGTGLVRLGTFAARAVPWVAAVTTIAYAGAKAWDWYRDRRERATDAERMVSAAAATRAGLATEIASVKTLDDKTRSLAKARELLADASARATAIRVDPKSTTAQEAAAASLVTERGRAVRAIQGINEANLGITQKEFEYRLRQIEVEREIADIQHQAAMGRANAVQREVLANERLKKIRKELAERDAMRKAQPEIDKANATAESEANRRLKERVELRSRQRQLDVEADKLRDRIKTGVFGKTGSTPGLDQKYAENRAERADLQKRIDILMNPSSAEAAALAKRRKLIEEGSSEHNILMQAAEGADKTDPKRAQELRLQAARLVAAKEDQLKAENAQLEATRGEREAASAQFKRDLATKKQVSRLMDASTMAVANGQFALAAASRKAAQDLQDKTDDQNRLAELILQNGNDRAKAEAQLAEEVTARTRGRDALRESRILTAGRGINETELELRARGINIGVGAEQGKSIIGANSSSITGGLGSGLNGSPGSELTKMKDVDAFMNNFNELTQGLGELTAGQTKQFSDLALKKTSLDILSQGSVLPGAGQVADSLAQLGLGGNVYAGPQGDPMLQAQKRIGDLTEKTNTLLSDIKTNLKMGVE